MTVASPPVTFGESAVAAEVRDRVREAMSRATPLRIVGAGGWLDAGRPVRAAARLALAGHAGIVEYVPGDLTLTARAGTTLADLDRATAAERQWLPLDPFGDDEGTLGATVATASAGPLAHAFGTPRDNVLGMEVVTGRGEIIRAGGRVVKNVAGFDLTRLMIGAWGTLGVITEVAVRLRARPDVDLTLVMPLPPDVEGLSRLLAGVRTGAVAPLALQLASTPLAARLGIGDQPVLLARLGGNDASVRSQQSVLASLARVREAPATTWSALRACEPESALVLRLAGSVSTLATRWIATLAAIGESRESLVHAWAGSGTVRVIVPAATRSELESLLTTVPATRAIGERLPAELWPRLGPGAADDPLARRVREAFDPLHLLNRGILGEGEP